MSEYIEVEIDLPELHWVLLRTMAKDQGISLNKLVNDILEQELDKLDAKDNPG